MGPVQLVAYDPHRGNRRRRAHLIGNSSSESLTRIDGDGREGRPECHGCRVFVRLVEVIHGKVPIACLAINLHVVAMLHDVEQQCLEYLVDWNGVSPSEALVVILLVELDEALEQFSGQLVFLETADNGAFSQISKPFGCVFCRWFVAVGVIFFEEFS